MANVPRAGTAFFKQRLVYRIKMDAHGEVCRTSVCSVQLAFERVAPRTLHSSSLMRGARRDRARLSMSAAYVALSSHLRKSLSHCPFSNVVKFGPSTRRWSVRARTKGDRWLPCLHALSRTPERRRNLQHVFRIGVGALTERPRAIRAALDPQPRSPFGTVVVEDSSFLLV